MNKIKIYHCNRCHANLEKFGEGVLSLYEEFCELYVNIGSPLCLDSRDVKTAKSLNTVLKFLELKGYISTTDSHELQPYVLKIIPNGMYQLTDDLFEFCPLNCTEEQRYKKD